MCYQPGRGAIAKLQEPSWGYIQGVEDDFRQSSRGGLLYHDKLLVFPQNASPFILQISPAALSYIFERLLNMITFTMYMLLYLIFKDKYVKIFKVDILFKIGIYRQMFLLTIDI